MELPRTILSYTSAARGAIRWLNALKIAKKENTYVRLEVPYDNRLKIGSMVRLVGFGQYSVIGIIKKITTKISFSRGLSMSLEVYSDYLLEIKLPEESEGPDNVKILVREPSNYFAFDNLRDVSNMLNKQPVETEEDVERWHNILLDRRIVSLKDERKKQIERNKQARFVQRRLMASRQTYVDISQFDETLNSMRDGYSSSQTDLGATQF